MIYAGQGVLYAEATDELVELAELLQVPVVTTLEGKSAFPEDHPLALGAGGTSLTGHGRPLVREADVVLARRRRAEPPRHVPGDPARARRSSRPPTTTATSTRGTPTDLPILGDAKLVLRS